MLIKVENFILNMVINLRYFILTLIFIFCFRLFAQKKYGKPIEVSSYLTGGISFSKLSNRKYDNRITTRAQGNFLEYIGLRLERTVFKDSRGLKVNISAFGQGLSNSYRINFADNDKSLTHTKTWYMGFIVLQSGLKKEFNSFGKSRLKMNTEIGLRFLIADRVDSEIVVDNYGKFDNKPLKATFKDEFVKKTSLLPYFATGIDYSISKKLKIGIQLWFQKGFKVIVQNDLKVEFGDYIFKSKVMSRGDMIGANCYVKLITF